MEKLSSEKIEELADKIYQLFKKNGIWGDVTIYFNGCALTNQDNYGEYHYDGTAYLQQDRDPSVSFEVNPEHILSMAFEGSSYYMFNHNTRPGVLKKFNDLLHKYGLYYEHGDAWNLSCYYE